MKKILAIMLAVFMLVSVFSVNAFAVDETEEDPADVEKVPVDIVVFDNEGEPIIIANPWDTAGVGNRWGTDIRDFDIAFDDVKSFIKEGGATVEFVLGGSPAGWWSDGTVVRLSFDRYIDGKVIPEKIDKLDENGDPVKDDDGNVVQEDNPEYKNATAMSLKLSLKQENGRYIATGALDTFIELAQTAGVSIDDMPFFIIQPGFDNCKIYSVKFTVMREPAPISINGEAFEGTLQEAVTAANNGDIIKIGKNLTEDGVVVPKDKEITIDIGGNTLIMDVTNSGKLALTNGTVDGAIVNTGALTLDNVTVKSSVTVNYAGENVSLTVNGNDTVVEGDLVITADESEETFEEIIKKISVELNAGFFKGKVTVNGEALNFEYNAETPVEPEEPIGPQFKPYEKTTELGLFDNNGQIGAVNVDVPNKEYTVSGTVANSGYLLLKALPSETADNLPHGVKINVSKIAYDGEAATDLSYTCEITEATGDKKDKEVLIWFKAPWGGGVCSDNVKAGKVTITFTVEDPTAEEIVPEPELKVTSLLSESNYVALYGNSENVSWNGSTVTVDGNGGILLNLGRTLNTNDSVDLKIAGTVAEGGSSVRAFLTVDGTGSSNVETYTEVVGDFEKTITFTASADGQTRVAIKGPAGGQLSGVTLTEVAIIEEVAPVEPDVPSEPTEADIKAALYKALGEKAVKIADGTKFTDADVKLFGVATFEVDGITLVGTKPVASSKNSGTVAFIYVNEEYHGMLLNGHLISQPHEADNIFDYCPVCHAIIEKDEEVEVEVVDPTEPGDVNTEPDEPTIDVTDPEPEQPKEEKNPPMGIAFAVLPMAVAAAALVSSKRR